MINRNYITNQPFIKFKMAWISSIISLFGSLSPLFYFKNIKLLRKSWFHFSKILFSPWHNGIVRSLTLFLMEVTTTLFCSFKQLCVNSSLEHQPPKFAKPLESFGSKHLLTVHFYSWFGCEFESFPGGWNWIALLILLSWSNFGIL